MSLSADSQGARVLSTLPAEIVDDIIEEACRTLDISSVSSIALTSHVFRIHANKARFSSLVPHRIVGHSIQHTAMGIRGLADIIRSGQAITTMPGVCSFATSFSLAMIGPHDEVTQALKDGSLACIFRNLFRPPLHTRPASSICSLSLHVYRQSPRKDRIYRDPRYGALNWRSINPELRQELMALLRESDITRLCLEAVRHIPRDFLRGTKIKHLYLRRVSIYRLCVNRDTTSDPEPVALESLDIDNSVSPTELGLIALPHLEIKIPLPLAHGPLLASLSQLHVIIEHASMFERLDELLSNTPHLQSLALTLNSNRCYHTPEEGTVLINYSHLKCLNRLSLVKSTETPLSHIANLLSLLRHNISTSITELEIQLPRWGDDISKVVRDLKDQNINILDSCLVHPAFDSIRRVIVGVELEITKSGSSCNPSTLLEECRSYVENQLPLLLEKKPDAQVYVKWTE